MGHRRADVEEAALFAKKFVRYDEGAKKYSMGLSKFQNMAREAKATWFSSTVICLRSTWRALRNSD